MVFVFVYSTIITFSISEAGWSSWGQQQSAQPPPVATPIVTSPPATSPTRAPSSTPSIAASEPPNGTLKKVIATLGHLTKILEFLTEISAYVTGTLTRRHFFIKSAFQFENTLNFFISGRWKGFESLFNLHKSRCRRLHYWKCFEKSRQETLSS